MPVRVAFGSWSKFLIEMGLRPLKYIPTKNGKTRKGTRNKSRARIINCNGYIEVFEPTHAAAMSNGYCLEHRMIAYDSGILTDLSCIVHHKDEDKLNNSVDNLDVMSNSEHTSHHCKGVKKKPKVIGSIHEVE